jgi:hypothetical protein
LLPAQGPAQRVAIQSHNLAWNGLAQEFFQAAVLTNY